MKSASTERAPMQRPPKAAAVGMYRFSSWIIEVSLWPLITICCSLSCLATSLAELPETSIQVLLKKAQEPSMNVMYRIAWIGSVRTLASVSGGDR